MLNAIEMINVKKTYQLKSSGVKTKALDNLNLEIPKGSIFGLLGPNGAGKSTLINIIAGLTNKSAGRVIIWGFDQDKNPRQSRASIGVVPQELNFDPFLTPKESLEIQAGLYGVVKKDRSTDRILSALGLSNVADSYSRSLSGGMKRRLLMAKALIHEPPILILDEPTAGVDIELREMIWSYVRKLNSKGTTIILTTHYLEEAQRMCDRIAILSMGKIKKSAQMNDLLTQHDNKVLIIYPESKIKTLPKFPDSISTRIRGDGALLFSFNKSDIAAEKIIDLCKEFGIPIKDISTAEPALEDVFKQVINS